MQQDAARPAFVFTEAPGDPSISRSTYENEDGIFFLSVHERPKMGEAICLPAPPFQEACERACCSAIARSKPA